VATCLPARAPNGNYTDQEADRQDLTYLSGQHPLVTVPAGQHKPLAATWSYSTLRLGAAQVSQVAQGSQAVVI
jgi:hypothetical protein